KGREQVGHGPGGDEDDDDVGHARERLGDVGQQLEACEDDEQHHKRGEELAFAHREIHRRMVLTEYHASPCQTRAASSIATPRIFRSPSGHLGLPSAREALLWCALVYSSARLAFLRSCSRSRVRIRRGRSRTGAWSSRSPKRSKTAPAWCCARRQVTPPLRPPRMPRVRGCRARSYCRPVRSRPVSSRRRSPTAPRWSRCADPSNRRWPSDVRTTLWAEVSS